MLEDEWMKFQGLINMSKAHKVAFDRNAIVVKTRASKISYATNLLISSVISIFIVVLLYLYQNYERRSQMTDNNENNSTKSSSSKPTMSSATTKPEVMLSTNRFTTQYLIHGIFSIENYTQKSESQKKSNNNSSKDK
jgi:FtsZ-interacting cell division protein ZipA